jgi:1-aminocyclopropane-1-carboxylate deaminase
LDEFLNQNKIEIREILPLPKGAPGLSLYVARLDLIHPIVSGNKLFKLYYFLAEAQQKNINTIVTFGGAYSNHLIATAYACQVKGLRSIGIVRGERPADLSPTLMNCEEYGMQLHFVSRGEYKQITSADMGSLPGQFEPCLIIPEGGYNPLGARGAARIMQVQELGLATHICTAVGTATTLAGLLLHSKPKQNIIGIPVIKNMEDIRERLKFLGANRHPDRLSIFTEYHFGGYAKYNSMLLEFMNELYKNYELPTDFVYTAKMMFGIFDKIKQGFFAPGSRIICLHTGGLQGNRSLATGTLNF